MAEGRGSTQKYHWDISHRSRELWSMVEYQSICCGLGQRESDLKQKESNGGGAEVKEL